MHKGATMIWKNFLTKVKDIFRRGDINDALFEELEELLLQADVGVPTTTLLMEELHKGVKEKRLKDSEKLFELFKEKVSELLGGSPSPLKMASHGPTVFLIVGVNGSGKTTSIGKLAGYFKSKGKKVFLAAGDTFRAAAIDQLEVWAHRTGAELIKHKEGADPGAVAYDAVKAAISRNGDVVIIDTAGRLHTKSNLMEELKKIRRVIQKEIPEAPHETLLVLDATTGQNAIQQAKTFKEAVEISGIILTKLDGSAKGGSILAIRRELGVPIKFIGIGEDIHALQEFHPQNFAAMLLENSTVS
jgi:fused signal recognition particle receptor